MSQHQGRDQPGERRVLTFAAYRRTQAADALLRARLGDLGSGDALGGSSPKADRSPAVPRHPR